MPMQVNGRCHCGAIEYDAVVDPAQVTICHCTDCQVLTGCAYRISVPVERQRFHLRKGTPATYVKVAASGAHRVQAFCATCGSPLYAHALGNPATYGLRVGCIEQRRLLAPQRQIWCASALPWSMDIRALPGQPAE
jgi:hypothetical protein